MRSDQRVNIPTKDEIDLELFRRFADEKGIAVEDDADLPPLVASVDRTEGGLRRNLLRALRTIKDKLPESDLKRAIASNHVAWFLREYLATAYNGEPKERLNQSLRYAHYRGAMVGARVLGSERVQIRSLLPLGKDAATNISFDIVNDWAVRYAETESGKRITEVTEDQVAGVSTLVAESMQGGATVDEVARQVRQSIGLHSRQIDALATYRDQLIKDGEDLARVDALTERRARGMLAQRARTIARTEVVRAASQGQRGLWNAAAGKNLFDPETTDRVWIATDDDLTDIHICLPMDGEKIPYADQWRLPNGATVDIPYQSHPNCYIPGQKMAGLIVGGLRAWYDGPVYEIRTAHGYRLTVTPNHPIMTRNGLAPAQSLRNGDDIFSYHRPIPEHGFWAGDNYQGPSMIENVFEALRRQGFSSTNIGTLDLHGDAKWTDCNVDIVGANGISDYRIKSSRLEKASKFVFEGAAVEGPFVNGLGLLDFSLKRDGSSGRGFPGPATLTDHGSSIKLQTAPFQELRLGPASDWDIPLTENSRQNGPTYSEFISQLLTRSSGQISPDRIVSISRFKFIGHVYDLQSKYGWIIAQNILTSNCRCSEALEFKEK